MDDKLKKYISSVLRAKPTQHNNVELTRSAVMVPLFLAAGDLWTIFVEKSNHLGAHAGQIAFPGGKVEEGEDEVKAALREAKEEVGIEKGEVLGFLSTQETPTGFCVIPVVAWIPFKKYKPTSVEISRVFTVPLTAILYPVLIEQKTVKYKNFEVRLPFIHVKGIPKPIWGVTLRIVTELLDTIQKNRFY